MKTRMWVGETDKYYNMTERKFYIDDPAYVPRVGEFVDGHRVGGWVDRVEWNYPMLAGQSLTAIATVYVYLKEKKND